jgi:DNA-binding transcriptional LysR family regulator
MEDRSATLAAELAPRLAVLRALGDTEHVTRAAEATGLAQPTVSRWLAELGAELGAPVIDRVGRGARLTRGGTLLAAAAGRAMAELEAGCRQAVEEADPDAGRVVFAFLHTMGVIRVPALLRAFRRRHPKVRFSLVQAGHEELLGRLRAGEVDLALTAPLPTGDPGLAEAVLLEQPLVLAVPAGHRLAGRRRVRVAELVEEEFIGFKPGHGLRGIADQACAAAGFTPRMSFVGEEADTVRGLISAGLGVALISPAEPAPPRGVVELPVAPRVSRTIGLVWARDRALPAAAERFRDFVLAPPDGRAYSVGDR